jgi:hypothetical protein
MIVDRGAVALLVSGIVSRGAALMPFDATARRNEPRNRRTTDGKAVAFSFS